MSISELLCPSPEHILVYKTKGVMLYSFFWTFPGVLILYADVSEHCQFYLHRWCKLTQPMKVELTECSETSAYKIKTPRNHKQERICHPEHDESLKSRKGVIFCGRYVISEGLKSDFSEASQVQ